MSQGYLYPKDSRSRESLYREAGESRGCPKCDSLTHEVVLMRWGCCRMCAADAGLTDYPAPRTPEHDGA